MEGDWDPEERKTKEAEIKNLTTKIDSYSRLHNHVQCLSAEIQYRAKHYLQKIWTCSHSEPYYPQRGDLQLQSQMCRAEPLPRQGHQRTKLLICGDERAKMVCGFTHSNVVYKTPKLLVVFFQSPFI